MISDCASLAIGSGSRLLFVFWGRTVIYLHGPHLRDYNPRDQLEMVLPLFFVYQTKLITLAIFLLTKKADCLGGLMKVPGHGWYEEVIGICC